MVTAYVSLTTSNLHQVGLLTLVGGHREVPDPLVIAE
jgi:hypothetical protein